jgi:apolipoprotein N-acyltransferase
MRILLVLASAAMVAGAVRSAHLYPLAWFALVPFLLYAQWWAPRIASPGKWIVRIVGFACIWTSGEWLTAQIFNAPRLHLGLSQQPFHSVCQVAELGGVYAVSFLVALGNAAIAAAIVDAVRADEHNIHARSPLPQLLVGLLIILSCTYGSWQIDDIEPLRDGPSPNAILNGATTSLRVFVEFPTRDQRPRDLSPQAIRCIERRIPLVARWPDGNVLLIDSRGRMKGPFESDDPAITSKPLKLDARRTIYDRVGDAFSWGCIGMALSYIIYQIVISIRLSRTAATPSQHGARPATHSSTAP